MIAQHDFDPLQMRYSEIIELDNILTKVMKSRELKVTEQEDTNDKQKDLHSVTFGQGQKDQTPTSTVLHDLYDSDDEADQFANAILYKSGDKMETFPSANIW